MGSGREGRGWGWVQMASLLVSMFIIGVLACMKFFKAVTLSLSFSLSLSHTHTDMHNLSNARIDMYVE